MSVCLVMCLLFHVTDNVLEIEPSCLQLDGVIGEGQFGDVCKGTYIAVVCTYNLNWICLCVEMFIL